MEQPVKRSRFLSLAGATALIAALAAPAAADRVYAWRTEDGGYAFADDPKSIPPRYRDRAELRQLGSLGHYPRYTPQDDRATAEYEDRLAERVERLRQFNAEPVAPGAAAGAAAARPSELVILRSAGGDRGGVDVAVPTDGPTEPLVIETVPTRRAGAPVTEHVQVTRRGDRIVSVSRPRLRVWNVSDVVDQDELLESVEAE